MKKIATGGFVALICLYTIVHYMQLIFGWNWLLLISSLAGLAAFIFTFGYIPLKKMALPSVLILLAGVISYFALDGNWFGTILTGIREMESLVVMLLVVPMVGWVFKDEPYIEEVMFFSRRWLYSSYRFFAGSIFVGQIISYFLLVGSVSMNYQIVNTFLKYRTNDLWEVFKSRSVLRGFALSTMWVFSIPSFSYAVEILGASFPIAILQGFLFSLVGIALSVIGLWIMEKKHNVSLSTGIIEELQRIESMKAKDTNGNVKVIEFAILFISLIGSIMLLHSLFSIDILTVIPPVVLLWTLSYFSIKRRFHRFFAESKSYLTSSMRWKAPEIMIMMTAGPLIYALNKSGIGQSFVEWSFLMTSGLEWLNFLWLLPFFVLILGFSGLGVAVAVILVGGILQSIHLPYPPELIVFSLTIGSVMTIVTSPFMVGIILLSGQNGKSLIENGMRRNWAFAAVFYIVGQIYIQLMLIIGN